MAIGMRLHDIYKMTSPNIFYDTMLASIRKIY